MLQKLFLSLNNFYMMYVKCLDGLFGQNLQGVRGSKGLDFKAQRWRFLWTVLVFRVKFKDFQHTRIYLFFLPLSIVNAPSIYRQEVCEHELIRFARQHVMVWLGCKYQTMSSIP